MPNPSRFLLVVAVLALLLAACQEVLPQEGEPPADTPAVDGARQVLARQLAISPEAITLIGLEEVEWPDGCLGIGLEGQACDQAITPGYRVVLEAEGLSFQLHTNQDGSQALLAGVPGSPGALALEWRREGGIAGFCDVLRIYLTGDIFAQTCGAETPARGQLSPDQLWQLFNWVNRLESFEMTQTDPAVADAMFLTLRFQGIGQNQADGSVHESILNLAGDLYANLAPVQQPPEPEPPATEPAVQGSALVNGRVCYPSEFIPALTAYFQNTGTQALTELAIAENQASYQLELPAGTYLAYVWRIEASLAGGYTAYIACGANESCTDHTLLPFEVRPGETTSGIDLCDWPLTEVPAPPVGVPGVDQGYTDPALSGLILSGPNGIWQVMDDGRLRLAYNRVEAILSPEGNQALFWDGQDLWLHDLAGPPPANLTNTPDRTEFLPAAWPAASGKLVFTSYESTMEAGPGITGFLTAMNLDGSGYQVLDPDHMAGLPAISPDGSTIAYGQGRNGWLYRWEGGISSLSPADFGLGQLSAMGSPAWSPDGGRIAWVSAGMINGEDLFAVAVLDLASGQGWVLHPHPLPGMDGFPPAPVWSPDGQWLAYNAFDVDMSRSGVWVLNADDPTRETHLGVGGNPVWSPDGRWLAYTGVNGEIQLVDTESWGSRPMPLPFKGMRLYDWRP